MTNVVVLVGRLASPAEVRLLAGERRLVSYQLTVARDGERAETVPVVWFDAPVGSESLPVDEPVTVVGRVRRRFFRVEGATRSRTEVVASAVVPCRQRKRAKAALDKARVTLEAAVA